MSGQTALLSGQTGPARHRSARAFSYATPPPGPPLANPAPAVWPLQVDEGYEVMRDCEIEIPLSAGRRHILFWPGPDFPLPKEWNGKHGSGEAMRLWERSPIHQPAVRIRFTKHTTCSRSAIESCRTGSETCSRTYWGLLLEIIIVRLTPPSASSAMPTT